MKKRFLQMSFGAAFLIIASSTNAQKITLNLNKGQKVKVLTTMEVKSTATAMGQDIESNIDSKSTTLVNIINNESNNYEVGQTITQMLSNVKMMGQEMSYDSDKKNNDGPLAVEMEKIVNKEKVVTIDNMGKVIKEEKPKDDEGGGPMGMFGASSSTSGVAIVNKSLFNQDIKVGNTWADSVNSDTEKMKTKTALNFKVIAVEADIATIGYEGTVTTAGMMEQNGQEMTMSGSSKLTGSLKVNIKNGVVLENNSTTTGNNNIEVAGMSIPVTLSTKTSSKVIPE